MRRDHGWTWVQRILASDWAIEGFRGTKDPLRTYQCLSRYLKNGHFSPHELKRFLPEIVRLWQEDCKRRGVSMPEPPLALTRKMEV